MFVFAIFVRALNRTSKIARENCVFKVAEHSFRARSCLRNSAHAQVLHKYKPDINKAIILFAQCPRYLYYFSSQMNTVY